MIAAAARAWRDAQEPGTPSLERLAVAVRQVDADVASGYVAVATEDETYRAFVPRELAAVIVAVLVQRPFEQVAIELAAGPARLVPST